MNLHRPWSRLPSFASSLLVTALLVTLWVADVGGSRQQSASLAFAQALQCINDTQGANDEPGQRINPDGAASVSKSPSFNGLTYGMNSSAEDLASEEEDQQLLPKSSLVRMGSMSLQRCLHEDVRYLQSPSPPRPKHKFEALDCLVISTIHSLSNKVRTSSRHLLEKLQLQQSDDENGALMEEMVSQLKELEVAASPQHKGPSRELSGTLKNLKKLEQVILVLDRILCGETEDM